MIAKAMLIIVPQMYSAPRIKELPAEGAEVEDADADADFDAELEALLWAALVIVLAPISRDLVLATF